MRYLWLLALVLTAGCGETGLCVNTEIRRLASPDGRLEAVLFERNCGATTGFSSQVSILAAGAALDPVGGNALVIDADHGAAPTEAWGGPEVEMRWVGPRTLRLRHHPAARVFHEGDRIAGVSIVRDASPHLNR